MVGSTSPSRAIGKRCVLNVEVLESRDVPSTSPFGLGSYGGSPAVTCSLFIDGTKMATDPYGLPSSMDGNIYFGHAASGPVVGKFHETLTPILMGGQFVGTTGAATFTFVVSTPFFSLPIETIKTTETTYIQGMDPLTGNLSVGSSGTIASSSGLFWGLKGGFTSSSVVCMGPQFNSDTNVEFTITVPGGLNSTLVTALAKAAPGTSTSLAPSTETSTSTTLNLTATGEPGTNVAPPPGQSSTGGVTTAAVDAALSGGAGTAGDEFDALGGWQAGIG
jgi:hypothetical protein